ncbi:MAG: Holliday junction branch migration protein RuvA [Deltaproteobacteria bacterium]|nr:Holliday junction branch migration protein RuvA [Deltaproteobacteria bacterium]MBW2052558.1 Holliday junction branch migration protein RuvA [Deltaproteobacteria bacterium]MBW2141733.1 Holliday junction branch migration protein RuvA [Deltaproteobacteria bacterium]MBW2323268.1 Holliday junction branch migration protein RuvA [Deltaproteobacteria bacterium]
MIAFLTGELKEKSASSVIIMTGGVGYEVFIPLSTFYALPEEEEGVSLHVQTIVREDSMQLFGFLTLAEKEAFLVLNAVSKIGPKLALNILCGISPGELVQAILNRDVARLNSVPGVGTKTAERLIVELKDKVAQLAASAPDEALAAAPETTDQIGLDVISALVNLGYRRPEAEKALRAARAETGEGIDLSGLLRLSLKKLQKA